MRAVNFWERFILKVRTVLGENKRSFFIKQKAIYYQPVCGVPFFSKSVTQKNGGIQLSFLASSKSSSSSCPSTNLYIDLTPENGARASKRGSLFLIEKKIPSQRIYKLIRASLTTISAESTTLPSARSPPAQLLFFPVYLLTRYVVVTRRKMGVTNLLGSERVFG